MLIAAIVIGSIFGYSVMTGITYKTIKLVDPSANDGAYAGAPCWPIVLPALLGFMLLDGALRRRRRKQLPSARIHEE